MTTFPEVAVAILGLIAILQLISVAVVTGGILLFLGLLIGAERRAPPKEKS